MTQHTNPVPVIQKAIDDWMAGSPKEREQPMADFIARRLASTPADAPSGEGLADALRHVCSTYGSVEISLAGEGFAYRQAFRRGEESWNTLRTAADPEPAEYHSATCTRNIIGEYGRCSCEPADELDPAGDGETRIINGEIVPVERMPTSLAMGEEMPEPAGSQEAIETLRELKRRTPYYTGEGPKPQHYQRIHRAYDAAIAVLAALPQPPADEVK